MVKKYKRLKADFSQSEKLRGSIPKKKIFDGFRFYLDDKTMYGLEFDKSPQRLKMREKALERKKELRSQGYHVRILHKKPTDLYKDGKR